LVLAMLGGFAGCRASLVNLEEGKAEGAERKILYYRSPMDPKVTSPTPKKDAMGMDYVPVYADEVGGPPSSVPGQATVEIDPARQQLIGLTTARVTAGPVGGAWRTVGRVAMDETRVRHVNVKISGFVERIYVDFVGKTVRQGDPLFALYSPELLSAQEEYLLALRTRGALSKGGALANDGEELVKAARRKLLLWDIPASEIDRIAAAGEATKTLTIYSPVSGVVTKKDVVEGMKLEAGAMPYEIVDLSSVWVLADVYESELRFIKEGMPATLTLNAFPAVEFTGKVLFIDPLLDPTTRTVKVRLAFENPRGELRPEMFGEVVLHGEPREGLRIPQDAVVDSGTEKIVFVALGNGKFQPRIVRLGDTSGNAVEVVSGLKDGEEVVTRANFLIDSESKLRASLIEMSGGSSAKQPQPNQGDSGVASPTHDGHRP
jgi:membrane fusion protein, copper/silver efflux system